MRNLIHLATLTFVALLGLAGADIIRQAFN